MDLRFSEEDEAFRTEVREWLEENLPSGWRNRGSAAPREEDQETRREWQRRLHRGGWLKLAWPAEDGGRAATAVQQAIYHEELARAAAPPIIGPLGVSLAAPTLNMIGSGWQKETYVEKILAGEEVWCQGFSEPDAGSDLAGLKTRAVREDGHWILNGQKVWSSGAHHADRSFLLARSDPTAPQHKGIGYFIVDLHQPGIEVRPIRQITGAGEFCEIFLKDVVVEDRDLVGGPGDGWKAAMITFGFERGGLANAYRFESAVEALAEVARGVGAGADPVARQRVAQAKVEATAFKMNALRALTRAQAGEAPGPEASLLKLFWSEMDKRTIQETAIAMQGMQGALAAGDRWSIEGGRWQYSWLWSQAETIFAGSSEIQRNIIAERVLGLPRGR
jgi:alkylation response protein AidB-like acyl-CoA dehydrogenase